MSEFNRRSLQRIDAVDSILNLAIHEMQRLPDDTLCKLRDITRLRRAVNSLRSARGLIDRERVAREGR